MPSPGLKRFAKPKPITKAKVVTTSKYTIVLTPSLPRLFASLCPAIPTTRVAKSNGAIIILTILKKISASTWVLIAKSGKAHPARIPRTSAPKIAIVKWEFFKLLTLINLYMSRLYIKQGYF